MFLLAIEVAPASSGAGCAAPSDEGRAAASQNDAFHFSDPKPESRTESFGSARRPGFSLKLRSFVNGSGPARPALRTPALLPVQSPAAPRAVTAAPQRFPHDGRPVPPLAAAAARRLPGRPPGRRVPPPLRLLRPRRGALHLPLLHRRPSAHRSGRRAHQPGVQQLAYAD